LPGFGRHSRARSPPDRAALIVAELILIVSLVLTFLVP
jgi:hypothetical protein